MDTQAIYHMDYDALREHVGHKLALNEVNDWHSNLETGIELRCEEKDCEGCEPLFEMDAPDVVRCANCENYLKREDAHEVQAGHLCSDCFDKVFPKK